MLAEIGHTPSEEVVPKTLLGRKGPIKSPFSRTIHEQTTTVVRLRTIVSSASCLFCNFFQFFHQSNPGMFD